MSLEFGVKTICDNISQKIMHLDPKSVKRLAKDMHIQTKGKTKGELCKELVMSLVACPHHHRGGGGPYPNIVISYNLSWATQTDQISGSEVKFVEQCTNRYGKIATDEILSGCTNEALKHLLDFNSINPFDILCIQEGTKYTKLFFEKLNHTGNYKYVESSVGHTKVATIYDYEKCGTAIEVYKGEVSQYETGRPFQILYFPDIKLLLINAHFPQPKFDPLEEVQNYIYESITPNIPNELNVERYIFCGDFNDSDGDITSIEIKGRELDNNSNVNTCCYPHWSSKGDYIFDSNSVEYFGILPKFNKVTGDSSDWEPFFGSDHAPVVSINKKIKL